MAEFLPTPALQGGYRGLAARVAYGLLHVRSMCPGDSEVVPEEAALLQAELSVWAFWGMANVIRVKYGSTHTLFPRHLSINATINSETFRHVRTVGSDSQTFLNSAHQRLTAGVWFDVT